MVTAAQVRAALVTLSRLDPRFVLRTDSGEGMVVGSLFRRGTVDDIMRDWDPNDPMHQAQGAQIVAWAREPDAYIVPASRGGSSGFPWAWVLGGALVLGGTWFAWRLVKNGR